MHGFILSSPKNCPLPPVFVPRRGPGPKTEALVHAKVEKQHKVPVEDVEAAAMVKQAELFNSADFLEILKKQQWLARHRNRPRRT